jgi:hypothetical protein
MWNARPIVPKGDAHHIYHNTAFNNDQIDIAIFSDQNHGGYNTQTHTQNNAANQISGARTTLEPVPGKMISNWIGQAQSAPEKVTTYLVDPSQHDFRPRANSPLIDAGVYHPQHTHTYLGKAPDIGAYEFGDTNYWIAGHIPAQASSPIPQCGAIDQSIHRDLIFQPGYQANTQHIYYGTHPRSLKKIATTAALHNVIQLHQYGITQKKGTTYYWRVDSQLPCNTVITGPLWHYTTQH